MKNYLIVSVLYLFLGVNQPSYEQAALNFFLNEIYPTLDSSKVSKIKFSYCVEKKPTQFTFLDDCFDDTNQSIRIALSKKATSYNSTLENRSLKIMVEKIRFRRRSKTELLVYEKVNLENSYYVRVDLLRRKLTLNAYFIKLDESGDVVDWCKSSVIF